MDKGLDSEKFWLEQKVIPGSTRVPVEEIKRYFPNGKKLTILDLGSGSGRSTSILKENFPDSQVVAYDLCIEGLKNTSPGVADRVQGTVLKLPFESESAEAVVLCGVMTNITDKDLDKAVKAREETLLEIERVLKPGGVCVISDFNRTHFLSGYGVNYSKHQLITGEEGTIAVFDPTQNISFVDKSEAELKVLAHSPHLRRFAHHYRPEELIRLCEPVGLKPVGYSTEMATTPSGHPIDSLVMTVVKP